MQWNWKMKNKREDRFEAIVDQFVKNDLIAQEEYSYYLYGVKHLEVLIMTTGGVLLSGILLKEMLFTVVFLITFSLLRIGWQDGIGFSYLQSLDSDSIERYGYISWEDLLAGKNNIKTLVETKFTGGGKPLDEEGNVIGE